MELYTSLLEALEREYDTIRCLKESPRGCVTLLRHRQSGTRLLFRRFTGSGAVYRRLLPLSSPHLPQILRRRHSLPPAFRTCGQGPTGKATGYSWESNSSSMRS